MVKHNQHKIISSEKGDESPERWKLIIENTHKRRKCWMFMKKRMRKMVSLTLAMCMTVPFLTACGSGKESKEEGNGKDTITVWYWEDNEGSYEEAYSTWSEKYPDVNLELESIPWNSYHDRLVAAAASGDLPDVYKIQPTWMPELVSMGAIEPLDEYIDAWEGRDTIPESMWNSAKADQDQTYSWPHSLVVLYLYCRKSYFEDAGLEYPKTMDEFYEACEKLTKDTDGDGVADTYGFSMRGARGGHFMWAGLTMNAGVDFLDDGGKIALNTDKMTEANQKYLDIYKNGWAPKTAPTDGMTEIVQNFESGVTAMLIHHLNSAQGIVDVLGDDVDVVPLPEGASGRYLPSEPCFWAVSSKSESKDAAVDFLKYSTEEEPHKALCKNAGLVPFVSPVTDDPEFTENKFCAASMEYLDDVKTFPVCDTWGEWSETVWPQTMQRALLGEITSGDMIETLADNLAGE